MEINIPKELDEFLKRTVKDEPFKFNDFDINDFGVCGLLDYNGKISLSDKGDAIKRFLLKFADEYMQAGNIESRKRDFEVFVEMLARAASVDLSGSTEPLPSLKKLPVPVMRIAVSSMRVYCEIKNVLNKSDFLENDYKGCFSKVSDNDKTEIKRVFEELYSTLKRYENLFGYIVEAETGELTGGENCHFYPSPKVYEKLETITLRNRQLNQDIFKHIMNAATEDVEWDDDFDSIVNDRNLSKLRENIFEHIKSLRPGSFPNGKIVDGGIEDRNDCLLDILAFAFKMMFIAHRFSGRDVRRDKKDLPMMHKCFEKLMSRVAKINFAADVINKDTWHKWIPILEEMPSQRELRQVLANIEPIHVPLLEDDYTKDPKGKIYLRGFSVSEINCEKSFINWKPSA